jgi:hypothetical protein
MLVCDQSMAKLISRKRDGGDLVSNTPTRSFRTERTIAGGDTSALPGRSGRVRWTKPDLFYLAARMLKSRKNGSDSICIQLFFYVPSAPFRGKTLLAGQRLGGLSPNAVAMISGLGGRVSKLTTGTTTNGSNMVMAPASGTPAVPQVENRMLALASPTPMPA